MTKPLNYPTWKSKQKITERNVFKKKKFLIKSVVIRAQQEDLTEQKCIREKHQKFPHIVFYSKKILLKSIWCYFSAFFFHPSLIRNYICICLRLFYELFFGTLFYNLFPECEINYFFACLTKWTCLMWLHVFVFWIEPKWKTLCAFLQHQKTC